jgi:hypothetical protein
VRSALKESGDTGLLVGPKAYILIKALAPNFAQRVRVGIGGMRYAPGVVVCTFQEQENEETRHTKAEQLK